MNTKGRFDEVMIVNPREPGFDSRLGAKLMSLHYGEPPIVGYGEAHPEFGYYGEAHPEFGYYGDAHPEFGDYGEHPELVGWGEHEPYGEYIPGYGIYEPAGYYAGEGGCGEYGEPPHDVAGYVKDGPTRFNAGCPMPTNLSGFGEP